MNEEMQALFKEVIRLRSLLKIETDKNSLLEKELLIYKEVERTNPNSFLLHKFEERKKDDMSFLSAYDEWKTRNNITLSDLQERNNLFKGFLSCEAERKPLEQSFQSANNAGINDVNPSISANKPPVPKPLSPEDWSNTRLYRLRMLLQEKVFTKSTRKAANHSSQILLRLLDNKELSHSEAMKITKMSIGGVGKLILRLKRAHLIQRCGRQHYKLLPLAMDCIFEVMEKMPPIEMNTAE